MLDTYQEVVVNSRVCNIVEKSRQKARHNLEVGEMGHQLAILYEVVEVPGGVNYSQNIVKLGGLVTL